MTKGHVQQFLETVHGILLDAESLDSNLRKGLDRDLSRLTSLSIEHGDSVFTLLLPAIGKQLDAALDRGFLPLLGLPLAGRVNTRTVIPRLFSGIWLKVFDIHGCLRQEFDPTFVLILRQLLFIGAKLRIDCTPSAVFRTTKEFFDVESKITPAPPPWRGNGIDLPQSGVGSLLDLHPTECDQPSLFETDDAERSLLGLCQRVADRVSSSFGEFLPQDWSFRHGPGATAEAPRGRGYKYSFPAWCNRLEAIFPYWEYGVPNSAVLLESYTVEDGIPESAYPPSSEGASRLIAVPKTQKGPRLIAAEPTANQWAQQCIADFLTAKIAEDARLPAGRRTLSASLDFRDQSKNGRLALESSRTAAYATVDLKEASDRLSCWLVQRLWRKNYSVLGAMIASRTRFLLNSVDKKQPAITELRKFATMGSALTFPIQSIAFFVLSISAGLYTRKLDAKHWKTLCKEVRVFGDDIIVPRDWLENLVHLLHMVGLKENPQKTFGGSNFRESCGVDAFRGYDVTPVKIKAFPTESRPGTVVSAIDTANNLFLRGLWHASKAYRSLVPPALSSRILTVRTGSGVWGDQSFVGSDVPSRKRWNDDLHRYEVSALQPISVKSRRHSSSRFEGYANLLQFFTEDPTDQFLSDWQSGLSSVAEAGIGRRWVAVEGLFA